MTAAPMAMISRTMSPPKEGAKVKKTDRNGLEDVVLTHCRSGEIGNMQLAPGACCRPPLSPCVES